MTGCRGKRRKQILDNAKEIKGCRILVTESESTRCRKVWGIPFARGYGQVLSRTFSTVSYISDIKFLYFVLFVIVGHVLLN